MDDGQGTLADQAASWVPPWARRPPETLEAQTLEAPTPPSERSVPDEAPTPSEASVPDETSTPREVPAPREAPELISPSEEANSADISDFSFLPDERLRGALEAILLVVDEPVSEPLLAQVLEQPVARVSRVLEELSAEYEAAGRGFELRRAAGGWRLYTRPDFADVVERFVLDGQRTRITQAALETLAVVAYKQPVTRGRISAIRGVSCDGVVRTLVSRGLIAECGSEPESGALLYRTTTLFLEKLGLDSVDQLPPLAPFLPTDVEEIADAQP